MVRPDMMTESEISAFPLLAQEQPFMYLAIRNLVMAIWALDIKVTVHTCTQHLHVPNVHLYMYMHREGGVFCVCVCISSGLHLFTFELKYV